MDANIEKEFEREKALEEGIFKALHHFNKPLKAREIAKFLGIPPEEREGLRAKLKELARSGKLVKLRGGKFALPEKMGLVVGKLCVYREGFGFVDPIDGGKGVFVPGRSMAGAMNGDIVAVEIVKEGREGRREGKIVSVIERAVKKVVGRVEKHKGQCFVVPEDKRIRYDVILTHGDCKNVENGDYVVVEIVSYPSETRGPVGKVVENLGKTGPKLDIELIIRKYDLPTEFPPEVLEEAEQIPLEVSEEEVKGRVDLRQQLCFTIDGENARDFDDAVAIEKLPNGNYRLFVHIADVSHYVKPGSALDREAYRRGTSVYFPDRCIPMLPERLSNGICSLNPNVDRLTFTCEMEINKKGMVVDYKIYESIIHSKARLTYTIAQRILDGDREAIEQFPHVVESLKTMLELAKILNKKRYKRGSLDFDLPEPVVVLNAEGEPVDIYKAERLWSHRIIEEFMIAANETVAEYMFWTDYPSIYRVHESPDREKLQEFLNFVRSLGIRVPAVKNDIQPKLLQKILEQVEGKPEEKLVNYLMLRTMARAKYSPDNIGHFGLASTYYTHFTSPIRRYADLQLHRLVKMALKGMFKPESIPAWEEKLEVICKHVTERSILADEAERDVVELKKLQFAANHIGEVFEAIVTGVTEQGLFVETIEQVIPGFVHVTNLKNDYYICVPKQYCLVGEKSGTVFRIGDRVLVKLLAVDIENRKAEFEVVKKLK
ncbi:ribonuclease R [Thermovibrio ammonificans HB-1]|uniref:Ribonuclease R n=1 Tax=Thermovibrio ammonificans (strain DSM 15698 / JCM 12110 / HB-1) TaxID=648996 RepID=E8T5X0_THEA1|nr:ribonuclease R [Thermovibrio ammonificans]ADU96554.1 ribonuclease R [Thermovibrio ammonificans HB-1]